MAQRNERQEEEQNGEEGRPGSGRPASRVGAGSESDARRETRDAGHRYYRIDWTCPRCGRESNRGDWYEADEIPALEEQIGREIWRCPHCRKRSHPREGTIRFTGHGRGTGADAGPDHQR